MKIESTLEKLYIAINRIQKISSKNLSLPILENVLLIAKDNTLLIRSTNLHVGTEISVPVKVISEGEVAVKLDLFLNIINSLKKDYKIVLDLTGDLLYIKTDKSEMKINTYSSIDFPTLPHVEDEISFIIPIKKFINGIKSVSYASSLSDIKPEIASVYIHVIDNQLTFVATDSFRLAEKKIIIKGIEDFPGIIVPIKNIQECIKIFNDVEGDVVLNIGKNQISLKNNDIYFTSNIVDGNYPNYTQIIPTEEKTSVIVLKNELISSLRLINVFSDSFNQIFLKTDIKNSFITFYSKNTDVGENSTHVEAAISGAEVEMYVNHKYLTDSFVSLDDDSIQLSFTEKNRPLVLKSVGSNDFLYLIMPMNR